MGGRIEAIPDPPGQPDGIHLEIQQDRIADVLMPVISTSLSVIFPERL
jgi:hypothetical protein